MPPANVNFSFGVAIVGACLIYAASDYEKPTYVWDEEEKKKAAGFVEKADQHLEAARAAKRFREETGDPRWTKVEREAEKKWRDEMAANPYRAKEVPAPKQNGIRAVGWLLALAGTVYGVYLLRRHLEDEAKLIRGPRLPPRAGGQ